MSESVQEKTFDLAIVGKLLGMVKEFYPNLVLAILFMILSALGELFLPILIKNIIDQVSNLALEGRLDQFPISDALLYLGILVSTMGANFLQIFLLSLLSQNLILKMRNRLYIHLLGQSMSWHQNQRVGKLVSALTSDLDTLSDFINNLISGFLRDILLMVGVVAVLFFVNTSLGLITVIAFPFVVFLIVFFRKQSRSAFRRVRKAVSSLNTFVNEHLSGISIIQLFTQEEATKSRFDTENREALNASLGEMYVNATFRPLIDVILSLSLGLIIWFGGGMVLDGWITLGTLVAYIELVRLFFRPVGEFAEYFSIIQSAMAGSERVFGLLEQHSEIPDTGQYEFPRDQVGLEFQNVTFGYVPGETVLSDLSFQIPPESTVAIVGYTGAGKTTITNLVARFWDPWSGRILANGRDLRDYRLQSLRHHVQGVLQDVQLFHGTIRENVTLGRDIDDFELREAARRSRLDKILERLDKGWDTELSNNGTNLSSGERQLVSFARVLCQNPAILILDEATSNIDSETEQLIQEGLTEVLRGRTSIVIAHRLSTIRNADRILVLDRGRLIEAGTHQELLDRKGLFYNLYLLQFQRSDSPTDFKSGRQGFR